MKKYKAVLLTIGMVLSTGILEAQHMAVPANLQAAIFKKIFGFDKTLQAKGKIEVAIVYGDGVAKDAIVAAFSDLGISAVPMKSDQVSQGLGNATIAYIVPGGVPPKQLCTRNRILSISGLPSFVENGQVSIGLSVEGGKPKILIHKGQLRAEGHELAEEILNMARIIQ
jgi:hypothetical protein